MPNLLLVKMGAQILAGVGVQKIVSEIVRNNVEVVTTAQKVTVNAGSIILGSMLWEQSSKHIDRQADELVKLYRNWTQKNDETKV